MDFPVPVKPPGQTAVLVHDAFVHRAGGGNIQRSSLRDAQRIPCRNGQCIPQDNIAVDGALRPRKDDAGPPAGIRHIPDGGSAGTAPGKYDPAAVGGKGHVGGVLPGTDAAAAGAVADTGRFPLSKKPSVMTVSASEALTACITPRKGGGHV